MAVGSVLIAVLTLAACLTCTQGVSYAGCYTQPPGISTATDVAKLGWTDKWEVGDLNIQFCINHCAHKSKKYAAVGAVGGAKKSCVCGTKTAYKMLGKADHKIAKQSCSNKIWYMNVYVASGDVGLQYIGCYREGTGSAASQSHIWIDKWIMTPNLCINYCESNGAGNANLREGDTCTCGNGYSKFGKAPESDCNLQCSGSLGQNCGGAKANSVYSTISIGTILTPGTLVVTHNYHPADVPKVPLTDKLMPALFTFQQAVDQQQPSPSVRSVGELINNALSVTQDVIGMKDPLTAVASSGGFLISNDPATRRWLSSPFPAELQPFADLIIRAHSFIDQDVQSVEDYVDDVAFKSMTWLAACRSTLRTLKGYVDNGLQFTGLSDAIKTAQRMVSAKRFCLPLMSKKKAMMATNLETVSSSLVEGAQGTKKYTQLLKSPLAASAVSIAAAPAVKINTWKGSLTSIGDGWEKFVGQYGGKLYQLISNRYSVLCPSGNPNSAIGKRSACKNETDVDFFDMAKRAGNNEAHKDIQKFISANKAAFSAFKWKDYEAKLNAIMADFKAIQKFIADAGISTPAAVSRLKDPFKSRQIYQTCAKNLSDMIQAVCFRTTAPDESKVTPIKC